MSTDSEGASRPVSDERTGSLGRLPSTAGFGPGFEGGGTVAPIVPPAGEHPAGVPETQRVPLRKALLYSSGNFGSGVYYAFNSFIVSILLLRLGVQPVLNNLLSSTRSVEGAVIQPLVGSWSDRTWRGFLGRRRFFIVLFTPISAVFIALTPFVANVSGIGQTFGLSTNTTAIILVAATIFLFTFTFNIMYDPYNALLADISPETQRGRVNGIFQAASASGQVAILIAAVILSLRGALPITPICIAVAVMLLIFFVPTVLGIREPRQLPGAITHQRYTWRDYAKALRGDRQVQLYFANQFLLWFGISAIQFNLIYYAKLELHFSDNGALLLSFILLLTTALPVWPLGVLGDRIGLKRIFLLGVILMSGAAIAGSLTVVPLLLYIILAIAGVGNAAQTASSYPLLTRLVYPEQMGLYTGLSTSVTSIAGPLGAILSGLLVGTIENPHFERLFPLVAVLFIASLIPLALIRVERSQLGKARAAAGQPVAA
ncbi:MAG: MFS transporter [Ktedonobacterales bacterium]|nr:MFS transporter [Ktedonobacterales bacterium]